jgi:4'-phosphopantetheinyl transferase
VVIAYGESPVGVDVERIRMDSGKENIARRYFTPEEQEYLFSAGEAEKAERFFEIWTAKESYLKYLGTGLRRSLNSFSVVPDGTGLGVRFTGRWLGDSYLTVCTRQEDITFTQLTPG